MDFGHFCSFGVACFWVNFGCFWVFGYAIEGLGGRVALGSCGFLRVGCFGFMTFCGFDGGGLDLGIVCFALGVRLAVVWIAGFDWVVFVGGSVVFVFEVGGW